MSLVDREILRYTDRIRTPTLDHVTRNDPQFVAEWVRVKKLLVAVDEAMMLQGISEDTRARVIRTVLLGSPDESDALERMAAREREMKLMNQRVSPLTFPPK